MRLTQLANQGGLNGCHQHGVRFNEGLRLLKVSHDGAFKFFIRDLWRKSHPEGHANGVISDKVVEVAFGFINGPIGEKVMLSKYGIAVASFNGEIEVVVFLGVGEKMG